MQDPKVFAIGFHRTGTTSIARALEILGYRFTGPNFTFEENLAETVTGLALGLAELYDAFSDSPWFLLYRELDEKFPGSKFILTVRPADSWLKSVRKLRAGTPMQRLIYGEEYIAAVGDARLRARYESHNNDVQEYFRDRPDDLLVVDLNAEVGWLPLCQLLGRAIPDVPFPHLNRSVRRRFPIKELGWKFQAKRNSHYLLATQNIPPPVPQVKGSSGRSVLLVSMSAGSGCVRAADAVAAALRRLAPAWQVKHVDLLRLPGADPLRRLMDDADRRAGQEPGRWKRKVGRQSRGSQLSGPALSWPQRFHLRMHSLLTEYRLKPLLPAFVETLRERRWDAVISTAPMVSHRLNSMKIGGALSIPLFVVNTDFAALPRDCLPRCDHFFASCENSAADLAALGWLPHKTTVTGIPVMPEFARPRDRQRCMERFGLHEDKPVVVVLSDRCGIESTGVILQEVVRTETPLQVLVHTGRNLNLRRQLENAPIPARHDVQILGDTDGFAELLTAADLVLSKPGGLISAEILAAGAAMAIINPVADHERQNRRYLMEGGAAMDIEHARLIPQRIQHLLAQPQKLAEFRSNARGMARPEAALDIARFVLEWFNHGAEPAQDAAAGDRLRTPVD